MMLTFHEVTLDMVCYVQYLYS